MASFEISLSYMSIEKFKVLSPQSRPLCPDKDITEKDKLLLDDGNHAWI